VRRNAPRALAFPWLLLLVLAPGLATAQDAATSGIPAWIDQDPFGTLPPDDPLASRAVEVAPTDEVIVERIPVRRGAILEAIPGVREQRHEVAVTFAHGFAHVAHRIDLVSGARRAAEVLYHLPVPEGAALASLEVCDDDGCREGRADPSRGPLGVYDDAVRSEGAAPGSPVAHAALLEGRLRLRAAPVRRSAILRVAYLVPAPVRGGVARLALPARGLDDRTQPGRYAVRSETLSGATVLGRDAVEGTVDVPAWRAVEVAARLRGGPPVEESLLAFACGPRPCRYYRAVAPPVRPSGQPVTVLLDVSPSMAGPAAGRLLPTLEALQRALAPEAPVRVVAFAGRAATLVEGAPARDLDLEALRIALEGLELGSATRVEAALPEIGEARRVLWVGDGGFTDGVAARRSLDALVDGREVVVVDIADRPPVDALQEALAGRATVLELGPEAARATRRRGLDPLIEGWNAALAGAVATRRSRWVTSVQTGEEARWLGVSRQRGARPAPEGWAHALADLALGRSTPLVAVERGAEARDTCDLRGPFTVPGAPLGPGELLALAHARRCDAPEPTAGAPEEEEDRGTVPPRPLLRMLRQRIVPAARLCFRDDRAGRPNYQVRVVYRFDLADREVVHQEVEGDVSDALRACLAAALDTLEIPPFGGRVRVSWPLYTEAELPPPTLALEVEVARAVDAVADE
jgi:hypothetical protein